MTKFFKTRWLIALAMVALLPLVAQSETIGPNLSINATAPLLFTPATQTLAMPAATSLVDGYLTATDWNTFNNKQSSGNFISALTGDITATGPGSVPATIASLAVTTGKIANDAVTDIKLANDAVTNAKLATDAVTNVKVAAAAAITRSKLASGSASHVLINDGSGVMSSEATLATTRGGTGLNTWTTGDIPYASATNVLSRLAAGTTGQVIRYVNGVPVAEDQNHPMAQVRLYEDWISDAVGTLRWLDADVGTGVSTTGLTVASNNHPGVLELDTGATATGSANRYLGGVTTGATTSGFILGGGQLEMEWLVRIENLSTAGERFTFDVGMVTAATGLTDGVALRYSDNLNAGVWTCTTAASSVMTNTATSSTVAADTWYRLRIVVNAAATSVDCYVNGVLLATNTTNIPTVTIAPRIRMLKQVGTTARMNYVDYFKLYQRFTTAR